MIVLDNKRFIIIGPPGSGKTELAKSILATTPEHVVYDPLDEYKEFTRWVPRDRDSKEELEMFITRYVRPKAPRLFLIDEANRYIEPKPTRLTQEVSAINDFARHWDLAWGLVTRRPSQFHSDVVELAHFLFVFGLHGKNDRRYLDDLVQGLGDQVDALPEFHFLILQNGRVLGIHAPVACKNLPTVP